MPGARAIPRALAEGVGGFVVDLTAVVSVAQALAFVLSVPLGD